MIRTTLVILALAGSVGAANAQSIETNPERLRADHRVSHVAGGSPGTVGAMEAHVYGLATSPQDVALQQTGRATTAEGAHQIQTPVPVETVGYGPGTGGATPGE